MTSVGFLPSRVRSVFGTWIAMVCTLRPWSPLTPAAAAERDEVQVLERTQRAEVEDRCRGRRRSRRPAGRRRPSRPPGSACIACAGEVRVVRGAADADVDRRARRGPCRGPRAAAPGDPGDRVGLRTVAGRVADVGDRPGVVEERVRVADLGGEPELVGHVGLGVAAVADVDLVEDVVAELEEVRAALRVLQRDEVGDEGDRRRTVRADERVDVGVVGDGVLGDLRRLAVR